MPVIVGACVGVRKPRTKLEPQDTTFDPTPYLRLAGEELRRYREQAGLSPKQLGQQIGMTYTAVNHVETARNSISLKKLLHAWATVAYPIPPPFVPRVPAHLTSTVELFVRASEKAQTAVRAYLLALEDPAALPADGILLQD